MQQTLPLRDVHLPDSVSWFPPAPGWWLLAVLIIGLLLLLRWSWRRWQARTPQPKIRPLAQRELDVLLTSHQTHQDNARLVQDLSALVKRVGLSYLPRREVAGLTGDQWYAQLNTLVKNHALPEASIKLLATAPYQRNPEIADGELAQLIEVIKHWIAALPKKKERSDV